MKVIYTKVLEMNKARNKPQQYADFTLGQEYELKKIERAIDDHEWMLENDYGYNHYFSSAMLFEYFTPVKSKKQVTISVAHQIVALDVELGCMQAELDNLKDRMAERRATLESLLDEYGVGDI